MMLIMIMTMTMTVTLEVRPDDGGDTKISINPRGSKIPANTVGFFIAGDCMEVAIESFLHLFDIQPAYYYR